jgi:putative transposase
MGVYGRHCKGPRHPRGGHRGFADHAHALVDLGAILGIAKVVQVLKANSSRWMKEHGSAGFEWQEGYFACSVSKSQVATIRQYVANQKDHHCRMDFAKEFKLLAKKHGFEIGIETNQQVGCAVP